MAKRKKRKPKADQPTETPDRPDPLKRHCPQCNTRYRNGWILVWGWWAIKGPPCCEGATLPADHWHAGCNGCGARWIEAGAQAVPPPRG